jgi:hypothetical protein
MNFAIQYMLITCRPLQELLLSGDGNVFFGFRVVTGVKLRCSACFCDSDTQTQSLIVA